MFLSASERAHRRWQGSQARPFLLREGDRKEWGGWDEGIKILDEEPGVLPASICTPPVSGQVGTTRLTTLHTQTSCHPWHHHTLGCAITAGVFPDLVLVVI